MTVVRRLFHRGNYSALGARALAAAAEPYAYVRAIDTWLSRAPRRHRTTGADPAVARRFRSLRLCGCCLFRSAAPALLESVAAYLPTMWLAFCASRLPAVRIFQFFLFFD